MRPQAGESTVSYAALLREKATNCDFHDRDERILEQIIQTTDNAELVRKVLHKKWTLQQTLAEIRVLEDTLMQAKAMGQKETNSLSKVSRRKKEKKKVSQYERTKEGIRTCKYCGGTHPLQKELCPAYGKFCSKCGKPNHFSVVCLSTRGPKGRFKGKTSRDDHTSAKRDSKRAMTDSETEGFDSDEDQGTDFI